MNLKTFQLMLYLLLSVNCFSQNDNFYSNYKEILKSNLRSDKIIEIGDSLNKIAVNEEQQIHSLLIKYTGYTFQSNTGKALEYLLLADSVAKETKNNKLSIRVNNEMVNLYTKLKLYDEAISKLNETSNIISNLPINTFYYNAKHLNLYFMARIYLDKKNLAQAKFYAVEALNLLEKNNIKNYNYIMSINLLGVIYEEDKNLDKALYYYDKMLNANKNYNHDSPNFKIIAYFNLANINEIKGNYNEALNFLNEAEKISKQFQIVENITSISKLRLTINKKLSADDAALKDLDLVVKKDSLKRIENDNKALILIINHQKKNIQKVEEKGINKVILGVIILVSLSCIGFFIGIKFVLKNSSIDNGIIKDLSKKYNHLTNSDKKSIKISNETEDIILSKLDKFEKKLKFLEPNISLANLSNEFNSNTVYLSEVINLQKKCNFNTYVNNLRINYIIDKLNNDPDYRNYKISYLAKEAGFKSQSIFTKNFKKVTGQLPSDYINDIKAA